MAAIGEAIEEAIRKWDKPLDPSLYDPDEEEKTFFKRETGITDDEELKRHIIATQTKAYSIYQYPCIRVLEFMRIKLGRLPAYPDLLRLGKERKNPIFIDLGCCFGNDCRKAVQDGYPVESVLASDLRRKLWDIGHELFKSTPETFPVPCIEGDILEPSFLEAVPPFTTENAPTAPAPPLKTVKTLNELRGHVSAVFTGAFFHLFEESQQEHIARALAGLLSPLPGSMLLGVQGGRPKKGLWGPTKGDFKMFCHSPESWKALWEGIFGEGNVEVKARLRAEVGGVEFFGTFPGNTDHYHVMEWSVIRK